MCVVLYTYSVPQAYNVFKKTLRNKKGMRKILDAERIEIYRCREEYDMEGEKVFMKEKGPI